MKLRHMKSRVFQRVEQWRERSRREPATKLESDAGEFWALNDARRRDLSHWKDHGRWKDQQAWLAIGEGHFCLYQELQKLAGDFSDRKTMVEWGPGGGSKVARFSRSFSTIYGVDISEPNLKECGRELASRRFEGFRPVHVDPAFPERALDTIAKPVDFFLSTAVYQHFPHQEYGRRVTQIASRLLAPKGLALIQIRYSNSDKRFHSKLRDYLTNAVSFTSYGISSFWRTLLKWDLEPLAVRLNPAINYAYYFVRKKA